ncbi:MAG: hypothetical protein QM754_02190 [Tepidisphaeraceae bacterium]
MSDKNGPKGKKPLTKRQQCDAMLRAMGLQTPDEQALEFQRRYLANWMRKRGGGDSSDAQ